MTEQNKLSQPLTLRSPQKMAGSGQFYRGALALSLTGILSGSPALAQEEELIMLDTMSIEDRTLDTNPYAEPGAPYKARVSGDKRRVKELAETPQTITVLTQTAIKDSGKSDLRDVLAAQPGISLGTGENGNAFGDRYVIRGHEARSDVFVDGLRDPGMTTRESFAVEQIEITKGPSSTFAGRGSTGGAVNSITKQASTEYNFNKVEAGVGTDAYRRLTLDSNIKLSEDLALRANVLSAYEEVPDREPAERERNGIALSSAWQATGKLDLVADYYFLEASDLPDLGSYIDSSSGKPVRDIPVYSQSEDFLDSEVETFTLRAGYQLADNLRLENATRYGSTDNGYVVTGTRGTTLSTHQGWQEVEYLANQTNLYWDTELGGKAHQWVFSVEYTRHDVVNGVYDYTTNGTPNCGTSYCIADDDGNYYSDLHNLMQRSISKGDADSDYNIDTWSLALMDTITLDDQWSVFLGLRLDSFDYHNVVTSGGTASEWDYSDELWNGHAGVVYQISPAANVYLSYSTSANINGGESDVGGSCGYGGLCGEVSTIGQSQPERTENIELGSKWNLLDDKLLATLAVFQMTKDDVMEGADYTTTGTLNTGKNRVDGVEVSLVGNLTEQLSVYFGASVMNAEVLESYNDGVNMTTDRSGNPVLTSDARGKTLANFADKSAYLQLRYQLSSAFAFGVSANYSSPVYTGQPDSAANEDLGVPSYTVYDLFASYAFSDKLTTRLNLGNVTDKDYYLTAYRSGAFTYLGDRRNAQLSLTYEF
ncbi:MAG: TonB-dependent receptor [Gammaproteobacteria bacterium]|nr:TonB-dependent receptor [Gammaproteobacteria bacterium]